MSKQDESRTMLYLTSELIPKFSGRDKTYPVSRWVLDVEENGEICGWTPLQQLLMARRSLSGTAQLWLQTERPHKTWEELKSALSKEFPDTVDIKAIHELMSQRKKRSDESCIDYMMVMKELGKRGKMPDYVAIKYVVDGIVDHETNKIMLYGVTTYSDLKEKLKIYEIIKEKMKLEHPRSTYKRNENRGNMNFKNKPTKKCYNCGNGDHVSVDCPQKAQGPKCFNCDEYGHISPRCPHKKNVAEERSSASRWRSSGGNKNHHGGASNSGSGSGERVTMFNQSTFDHTSHQETSYSDADVTDVSDDDSKRQSQMKFDIFDVNKPQPEKPMKIVELFGKPTSALIDSGSDVNLVSSEFCVNVDIVTNNNITLSGLGFTKIESLGCVTTNIVIDGTKYYDVLFYVVPKDCMPFDIIIGLEFLKSVITVMNGSDVWMKPVKWVNQINCFNSSVDVGPLCNTFLKEEVIKMVESYQPCQVKEAPIQLKIIVKDDVPVVQRPRRISLKEQVVVEEQVAEWLEQGIIRVSYSEYASPLVLVRKKDGTIRVCVDYRKLNSKIVKDEFPLPIIEDYIDKLAEAKVFSVLDLKNGFFHLNVSHESIKYTAFVTHHGQFEFLKAPFGLSICPNYFMRFVTIIFRELISKGIVLIFVDDILIPAKDEHQAVERLREVLKVASEYGLQINWKKAHLICRSITYLGHTIENGQVRPASEKIDAVMRFPEPNCVKQLHSFIGLASYFRKYIQNFASIARPLTDLLKKDTSFEFNKEQRCAFNCLKERLTTKPVLQIFNPRLETEMHTDASCLAYAAILMQRSNDDGGLHPVYFMSRKTNDAEKKYSSYELESLAIIEGVKKFRHYLYGIHFKIVTDCQAFQMTLKKKDLCTRVARWALLLQEFDFVVEHRSGTRMKHTDALSRNPYVAAVTLHDEVKQAQQLDDGLKAIIEILQNTTYKDYYLDNGLLYKGTEKRLVIPKSMENEIIRRAHANGHFARKKMIELISKDYYINNLDKKIEEFITTCIPCLLATRKAGKQEGFLTPIEKEESPLHTLHLDHIGPMTETKKQYNHILTIMDAFTKFTWIFPTKGTTSKETIEKLKIHQQHFGNPTRFITDRGTAYTSNEFQEYCKDENIQHIKITTGVPRGNGQVERVHRVIISVLTKLCIENPALWYRHVSRLQRSLNSTFQRSISTTPYQLMIGTKMRLKEDIEIYDLLLQEERDSYSEEREKLRERAKEQILQVQEENIKNFNKKRKESTKYKEGDLVAIKRTQFGTGMKLKAKYLGPYQIVKVKRNNRYDVKKLDPNAEGPGVTSSSADFMKAWPDGNYLD